MSVLTELPGILSDARRMYEKLLSDREDHGFERMFSAGASPEGEDPAAGNFIAQCDNLQLLSSGVRSGVLRGIYDLIYCDPPFFTRGDRPVRIPVHSSRCPDIRELRLAAYNDNRRTEFSDYLRELTVRLLFMRDTLKETGSIFVHLDTHAVHAVKLLMDEIFGPENFVNEIIWNYKSGGAAKRSLSRKHDTILFYSRGANYKFHVLREKSYNRGMKPYRFQNVEEFQDKIGWYTMVNLKDVWQIDMVGRSSGERLHYATQKPEALLERIVAMTTEKGDFCADFFSGSGTLAACAARAGRRFHCADQTGLAITNTMKRPLLQGVPFDVYCSSRIESDSGIKPALADRLRVQGVHEVIRLRNASKSFAKRKKKGSAGAQRVDNYSRLLAEDPAALVDYWCTGNLTEDGTFLCHQVAVRDRRGNLSMELHRTEGADHVWGADLCGRPFLIGIER